MRSAAIIMLLLLSSIVSSSIAQASWLNEVTGGLESRHHFYNTKWVCTGDTLAIDTTENDGVIVQLDGFWITCCEVTNDMYNWYIKQTLDEWEDALLPKTGCSAMEVDSFCQQLNNSTHANWRLPTESEWLFAFRGGLFSEGYIFSGSNHAELVAWTKKNSGGKLHEGGTRIANELGLYDMSGNTAEMVTGNDGIHFLGGSSCDDISLHSTPPPDFCGFRIVYPQPQWFNKYGERVFR